MKVSDVESQVLQMASQHFQIAPGEISRDTGPGELPGWDSIGHLQLIRKLESQFQLQFTVHDIMVLNTLGSISETIAERAK